MDFSASKRPRIEPSKAQELKAGAQVIFDGGKRGVIKQAYPPLDEFWIVDSETGQMVRADDGDIRAFKSKELTLASSASKDPAAAAAAAQTAVPRAIGSAATKGCPARILLIATETHASQILQHQDVDPSKRKDHALMLAVPTSHCRCADDCQRFDPLSMQTCSDVCPLLQIANEGVDDTLRDLASSMRPDVEVEVRIYHLKQAIEQIGPDLASMDGWYCLSSIALPFDSQEISQAEGLDRDYRENVRCQIDVGVSATGPPEGAETPEETAARALLQACSVHLSPSLFSEEAQFKLRQRLNVDVPIKFWDKQEKVFVVILPEEAVSFTRQDGALCFQLDGNQNAPVKAAITTIPGPSAYSKPEGKKDVTDWKNAQGEFRHLGKLPKPWIFVKSTKDASLIYYLNTETHRTQMERPLPPGWTKQKSKSTGKTYFFNAKLKKSMFDYPPPE